MKAAVKKTKGRAPRPPTSPPLRRAGIEALRSLDEEAKDRIVDYVTSGVPIGALREELKLTHGLDVADNAVMSQFYQEEASKRWAGKIETASIDAESILNILRNSNLDFSEALLQTLGQETFRMITQRELDCKQIEKFTRLLLQARAQNNAKERMRETLKLQRLKIKHGMKGQMEKALEAMAAEIGNNPEAREMFEAFREKIGGKNAG